MAKSRHTPGFRLGFGDRHYTITNGFGSALHYRIHVTAAIMSSSQEIIIEPRRAVRHYWRDLWQYRELFYFMAWRDVLIRYKNLSIGFAWALLRPFLTMLILTLVFNRFAGLPSQGIPYPVLVYSALLPWLFFAQAFADAGNSLVNKESIINKIYFPRMIVPTSAVVVSFVDFLAALSVLVLLLAWYRYLPGWQIAALPLFMLMAFVLALGAGLWISALSVQYRDFRYIIPFSVQIGLYLSPVGYDSSLVPLEWRSWYALNPLVGIIEGFRWSVSGRLMPHLLHDISLSLAVMLVLSVSGILYFRRIERSLSELL
jgi:lipopolysaccharide transport system permease protein